MSQFGWSRFEALVEDHVACDLATIQACLWPDNRFLPPGCVIVGVVGLRSSPWIRIGLTDRSQEINVDVDYIVRHER